jgi:hypothetical protein
VGRQGKSLQAKDVDHPIEIEPRPIAGVFSFVQFAAGLVLVVGAIGPSFGTKPTAMAIPREQ